jgi:hypothetical protein
MGLAARQACSDLPNLPVEWNPDDHWLPRPKKEPTLRAAPPAEEMVQAEQQHVLGAGPRRRQRGRQDAVQLVHRNRVRGGIQG